MDFCAGEPREAGVQSVELSTVPIPEGQVCLAAHPIVGGYETRGIVASKEEGDLAFVYALGFAMYLGGPFFYAEQRGWS